MQMEYSGTPLIRPPTGHENSVVLINGVVVLTG